MFKYVYWRLRGYIGKYLGCKVYKRKKKLVFTAEKEEYINNVIKEMTSLFRF